MFSSLEEAKVIGILIVSSFCCLIVGFSLSKVIPSAYAYLSSENYNRTNMLIPLIFLESVLIFGLIFVFLISRIS